MFLDRTIEEMIERPRTILGSIDEDQVKDHLNYLYDTYKPDELNDTNLIYNSSSVGAKDKFLKGRFYLFNYTYYNVTSDRDFIDTKPLIFVLEEMINKDYRKIKGFNLNFLPFESKVWLLEVYCNIFKRVHERDVTNLHNGDLRIYIHRGSEIDYFFEEMHKYLPKISNAIRYWDISRINVRDVTVIRPQDYNILPYFEGFRKSIRGLDWRNVQSQIFN